MEKYHTVHEEDISSFDLPSTHRLPTVSAAEALEDLDGGVGRHISTGIARLDETLVSSFSRFDSGPARGGFQRGQVSEIWGPPGSGKTALGIQLVANALYDGHGAVWVDCAYSVCGQRLNAVIEAVEQTRPSTDDGPGKPSSDNLAHYSCPSLPHLIALLCRPTAATLPAKTALVIIDSLSALVNHAFPKASDGRKGPPQGKGFLGPGLSAKRLQALQYMASALQKLAATRDCAVVVLSQCATRMQLERSATLIPSINAGIWEQGMSTRVVLFRDWVWKDGRPSTVSFAGVQKLDGKAGPDMMQNAAAFRVEATGVVGVHYDTSQPSVLVSSNGPRAKRKLVETGLEVPDSEEEDDDEEYGWAREDDAALPGPPPQWQGSEDLLLGTQAVGSEEDGDNDDTGDEAEVERAAVSGRDSDEVAE
ncbi:P-loop containing nucleoside triphosphate hydrolase protein [Colletotrichum zoysiae]|uniref:P-loop containing nucleoside triphosphate hydrolase protein n=1 Tax=Colletotrichum zoysiae TaxID=1216348 RepID=A0AAD9LXP6_9PEZI|nr:P-loop containing nucleoside triphosphate hydrolase protein [Colletotrichum zoysiae]